MSAGCISPCPHPNTLPLLASKTFLVISCIIFLFISSLKFCCYLILFLLMLRFINLCGFLDDEMPEYFKETLQNFMIIVAEF